MNRTPLPALPALRALACLVALSSATASAIGTNKLSNATFTNGLSSWVTFDAPTFSTTHLPGYGHDALGSVNLLVTGTEKLNHMVLRQCMAVKGGATYDFGGWFLYPNGLATVPQAFVGVHWHTAPGCTPISHVASSSTALTSDESPQTWLKAETTAVAPPQAVGAYLYVAIRTAAAASSAGVIDDVYFTGGIVGDVNADGSVNVADVFALVNFLFAGGPPPIGPADVDGNDAVNVADTFYLINFLFANGPVPVS